MRRSGKWKYLPAAEINAGTVKEADALFVRTRNPVRQPAAFRKPREVHRYRNDRHRPYRPPDIAAKTASPYTTPPDATPPAVAQYVFAAIGKFLHGQSPENLTLGVVGVGHVGSIVARWGERLGMRVMPCDPPRQRKKGGGFASLEKIAAEADIITFHTPLTVDGGDRTFHLADKAFFNSLKKCKLLINSSRGPVVDNTALLDAINGKKIEAAAIDCWENEPEINRQLLEKAFIATPHIAGYSSDGKKRATAMVLEAFCRHFNVKIDGIPHTDAPAAGADITSIRQVMESYDPLSDTARLKANPDKFEQLRNTLPPPPRMPVGIPKGFLLTAYKREGGLRHHAAIRLSK